MTTPAPYPACPQEPSPQGGPAGARPKRSVRKYVYGALAILLGLVLFLRLMVYPTMHGRAILRAYCTLSEKDARAQISRVRELNYVTVPNGSLTAEDVRALTTISRYYGPDVVAPVLAHYLRMPAFVAPQKTDAVVLLRYCGPNGIAPLIAALGRSDPALRAEAATQLGLLGQSANSAIPALEKALEDENADVNQAAGSALKKIRCQEPPK